MRGGQRVVETVVWTVDAMVNTMALTKAAEKVIEKAVVTVDELDLTWVGLQEDERVLRMAEMKAEYWVDNSVERLVAHWVVCWVDDQDL